MTIVRKAQFPQEPGAWRHGALHDGRSTRAEMGALVGKGDMAEGHHHAARSLQTRVRRPVHRSPCGVD